MLHPQLGREDLKVLPLALVGLIGGIIKYFVAEPINTALAGWVEGHTEHLDSLDAYIGEMATKFWPEA